MIYYIDNDSWEKGDASPDLDIDNRPYLCFFTEEEFAATSAALQISDRIVQEFKSGQDFKFESHEGFEYISLSIPVLKDRLQEKNHTIIYFRKDLLIFVSDNSDQLPVFSRIQIELQKEDSESHNLSLEKIMQLFFDILTYEDSLIIESIEDEASDLEEALITSRTGNYINGIIQLRKKLLAIKRYYDQLASISSVIEENENGLLTDKGVRFFHILTRRTERMLNDIDNLQDYVSQIREAYQAQVDIDQNGVMKLFTVITAIFLPLTLIVGWYGMNLQMPEYHWYLGYPVVILLSASVALGSFLYFKRHNWF